MSASPIARQSALLNVSSSSTSSSPTSIPTRRININNPSDLPSDYSTTPGGTFYSTTPGGTRLVYDRSFLINLRNSPLSRTPPKNMQFNPNNNNNEVEQTQKGKGQGTVNNKVKPVAAVAAAAAASGDFAQFEMDL